MNENKLNEVREELEELGREIRKVFEYSEDYTYNEINKALHYYSNKVTSIINLTKDKEDWNGKT